jgi:hypothetical protein
LLSAQGGSGTVTQTVPGAAGTQYTFSAGARWEPNFAGTLEDGQNQTTLELAFLNEMGEVVSSAVLDLRADGKTAAANSWTTHSVSATAPEGTVDVRVSGIVSNLTSNPLGGAQSAFWDDFSLMAASAPTLPGDANGDGTVDLLDLSILGANFGQSPRTFAQGNFNEPADTVVDLLDLSILGANFGATLGAVAVPEPASALLVLAGVALAATRRRV